MGKSAFKAVKGIDGVANYISGTTYKIGEIREKDLIFYKAKVVTSTSFILSEWDLVGESNTGGVNGLTKVGANVKLGGTLTGDTTVNTGNYAFAIGNGITILDGVVNHDRVLITNRILLYDTPESGTTTQILTRDASSGLIGYVNKETLHTATLADNGLSVVSGDTIVLGGTLTGDTTIITNDNSFIIGNASTATGTSSMAFGCSSSAGGNCSFVAGGRGANASGERSHAEGSYTEAIGRWSHAEGIQSKAIGDSSHAEGSSTCTFGYYSHAEGKSTNSCGNASHAEGYFTVASGISSHAEGCLTKAIGNNSHAEGIRTHACGDASHSGGYGVTSKEICAIGSASFNHSFNGGAQTIGHGVLANDSVILGGRNHNIESGNCRAAIIGGDLIKLTGTSYIDTTAVAKLALMDTPTSGASTQVLTRNTSTGVIEYTSSSEFTGGTGGSSTWIDLTDTDPTGYTGNGGKGVRVNAGQDGLEFYTITGGSSNSYVSGMTFNSGDGILTLTRTDALPDITQDLDGRYSLTGHSHTDFWKTSGTTTLVGTPIVNFNAGNLNFTGTGNIFEIDTRSLDIQLTEATGFDAQLRNHAIGSGYGRWIMQLCVTSDRDITLELHNLDGLCLRNWNSATGCGTEMRFVNNDGICIHDDHNFTGLYYDSATFRLSGATSKGNEWITDKGYDDCHIGGKLTSTLLRTPTSGETNYVIAWDNSNNYYDLVPASSGGTSTWIDLTDTDPTGYTGNGGLGVRVNGGETGLEFYTLSGGTNSYVTGMTFNTGDGILTLTRNNALPDITQDLDGRYYLDTNPSGFTTNSSISTLTNKTIDADGTGNVITNIGSSEIKIEMITGFTTVSGSSGDFVLVSDASDSGNLKKVDVNDFLGGGTGLTQTPWTSNIDAATNYLYNIPTIRDANENEIVEFGSVASAVNHVKLTNSITGSTPIIEVVGTDTNIGIAITPKGSGTVDLSGNVELQTSKTFFRAFDEDSVRLKHTNFYVSDTFQSGQGQSWKELWFGMMKAADAERRIGFYLEQPDAGSSDAVGGSSDQSTNYGMVLDVTGLTINTGNTLTLLEAPISGASTQVLTRNTTTGKIEYTHSSGFTGGGSQTPWTTNIDAGTNYLYNIPSIRDANENEILELSGVSSAVNHIKFTNAASGGTLRMEAIGTDGHIALTIASKGSDPIQFEAGGTTSMQVTSTKLRGNNNNAAGMMTTETTSSTNPTVLFDQSDETSGLGGVGVSYTSIINQSVEGIRVEKATTSTNIGLNGSSFGSGDGVVFIASATTTPSTNPVGGGLLFVEGDALNYRDTNGIVSNLAKQEAIQVAVSDETTDLTTGTTKLTFRMAYGFTLTDVRASVSTAPSGSTITIDINEGGVSILSTLLTIDSSEKTSTTAATAPVISDTVLADDAEITMDIDQIGSTTAGAGLKVTLIGYR